MFCSALVIPDTRVCPCSLVVLVTAAHPVRAGGLSPEPACLASAGHPSDTLSSPEPQLHQIICQNLQLQKRERMDFGGK